MVNRVHSPRQEELWQYHDSEEFIHLSIQTLGEHEKLMFELPLTDAIKMTFLILNLLLHLCSSSGMDDAVVNKRLQEMFESHMLAKDPQLPATYSSAHRSPSLNPFVFKTLFSCHFIQFNSSL